MSSDPVALQAQVDRLKLELQSLQAKSGHEEITVGGYLLTRLAQLGVTAMFGLPGDFNLGFLDIVEDHPSIDWVGNCNELNAAYAADGYARLKPNSLGVVTTTFGVGELSAMNGIAGAFSEMVPVLHIAGVPSTVQQKARPLLHHTLGDGRYDAYRKASDQFTIHSAYLEHKSTAPKQIDEAITQCITQARPVYLTLPTDLVYQEVSTERLKIPLARSIPANPPQEEEFVLDLIHDRVKDAEGDVVILVDACVSRYHVQSEVNEFLTETGFPVYSTPMGKSIVDESYKRYGGIYVGTLTHPQVKERVEGSTLIISFGSLGTDFNTGNFSYNIPNRRHIELHSNYTRVQYARFDGIGMKQLLPKLTEKLQHFRARASKITVPAFVKHIHQENTPVISHKWLWSRLAYFFQPKDVIVTETGTSNFGILDVPLPPGSILVNQILWGSIGWSVGSCLGAALGARDTNMNRTILFVGDGSLQLTVQELSPMLKKGLKPIIFVLNNSGYTIERCIHGKHRKYNDISNWKWPSLLDTLNDSGKIPTASYTVDSKTALDQLLNDQQFGKADKMQLVEVIMEALDAPESLVRQADLTSQGNRYTG